MFKSFGSYITESTVSLQALEKVIAIFKKFFERRMQTKLYRFGGDEGTVRLAKNGIGILFIYNKVKAIRFNYLAGAIRSITLWNHYKLGATGDKTISLADVNLTQAASLIIDILQGGAKIGDYPILPDPTATPKELITEAKKKVTPADFVELIRPSLNGGETIHDVSLDLCTQIAVQNGVMFPSVFWSSCKLPNVRGQGTRFDLGRLAANGAKSDGTPVQTVTVTATDKVTTPNMVDAGRVTSLDTAAKKAIMDPDIKRAMMDPDNLFGIMKNLTQLVCRGARKALVIYGGPGTGKTHTVTETLGDEGMTKGKDWILLKGKITTSALYQTLFLHRKDRLLVFDDTDSVWGDAEAANILKAALDSYDERTVSWITAKTVNVSRMTDDEREALNDQVDADYASGKEQSKIKLPSEFIYTGKIIFISNLPYEKFDDAVLTRSAKIDMTLTPEQMFKRMESVLPFLGNKAVPLSAKQDILKFLKDIHAEGSLENPSMRTYAAAEDLYLSGLPNWKELLAFV